MKEHKKLSGISLYVILVISIIIIAKHFFFQFSSQLFKYCRKTMYRLNFVLEHKELICSYARQFCSRQFKRYQLQLLSTHTFSTQTILRDYSRESQTHHSSWWWRLCPGNYNSHLGISILWNSLVILSKIHARAAVLWKISSSAYVSVTYF